MQSIIGWDIGGAHVKAARCEAGRIVGVAQVACPLWLGLDELHRAIAEAKAIVGSADLHAATMTAELCDAFATRAEGVEGVAEIAVRDLAPERVIFYAGPTGFVEPDAVGSHTDVIASANWHASAALAARQHRQALFIDMGSTTTDLISIRDGAVATCGYSDAGRLAHGELVYAGAVRSYLIAGLRLVPFDGRWVPLMNEWFASSGDVYRILGELPGDADVMQTADGRGKTVEASRARLARQIGHDVADASPQAWTQLARYFAEAQLREITDAVHLLLSRGGIIDAAPIVAAGVGRFVLERVATRLGRRCIDFSSLVDATAEVRRKACDCAPASAVALLAHAVFAAA